ncbi:MAG: hypothetical protein Q7U28_15080 [Aquabacterium sp.]|nr:hypothetical protein [Aquabacterium sp.]
MVSISLRWLVPAGLTLALPMAFAQPSAGSAAPDPKSLAPSSVTLGYRSAFADYHMYSEQPIASWREANDNVGKIGGWRVYSKEARQPDGASAPVPGGQGDKP